MSDWTSISAYADGELGEAERQEVEERLQSCEQSQRELLAVLTLKETVQTKCVAMECSETWAKCQGRIRELEKTRRVENFVGRYAWGLCSVFLVLILGAAMLTRTNGTGLRTGDLMSSMLSPIPGPTSQAPEELRRWLGSVLEAPVVQPDTVAVTGAATGFVEGRRAVRLHLADQRGEMVMFVISEVDRIDDVERLDSKRPYYVRRLNNVNCVAWTFEGNAFIMMGDRPFEELCQIAQIVAPH
jgi:hypothetical protein